MIVTEGKEYQTRDGRAVQISSYQGAGGFPIMGVVAGRGIIDYWTELGRWGHHGYADNPLDLIEVHAALPTIFRDMCDADKGALLLAKRDQVKVEWYNNISEIWFWNDYPYLRDDTAYRIAPKRIAGTVEVDAYGKPDFNTWWTS